MKSNKKLVPNENSQIWSTSRAHHSSHVRPGQMKKKKKKKLKNFRPRREKGETALHRHSRNKIKKYSAGNKREKTGEFKYVASYQKHSVAII
jgi:hypothetical protein